MKRLLIVLILFITATGLPAIAVDGDPPAVQERCTTALEVIERNLDAVGGKEKLRAIESLVLEGETGSALLTGGQEVTVFLRKPDSMKQEGLFQIYLYDGWRVIFNNGGAKSAVTGSDLDEFRYRVGFYHNGFSLLEWEEFFPAAELAGVKRYGPAEQYVVRFPAAENGHDLTVYIDAETFLIDRIIFVIDHPDAKQLKIVNRLRDFKEFEGLLFPTRLVYDKVGWEESPSHFKISGIQINPKLEDEVFESSDIDFGTVACEGNTIRGEIRGAMESYLLTNVRMEDLAAIGAELEDWLELQVGDARMKVKLLDNIQASAKIIRPNEVYLCRYPISGYRRMILMGFGVEVLTEIPCKRGDALILTLLEDGAGAEEENEGDADGSN